MSKQSSESQVLRLIERIRARAMKLVKPGTVALPAEDDAGSLSELREVADQFELRLPRMTRLFDLSDLEMVALVCLIAAEYDPYLRHALRAVQGDGPRQWLELGTISELLDLPLRDVPKLLRLFRPDGALRRWGLVVVDDRAALPGPLRRAKIHYSVAEHLMGMEGLAPATRRIDPRVSLSASLVPPALGRGVAASLRRALATAQPLVLEITGAAGGGRRHFAEGLAQELGRRLVVVDLAAIPAADVEEAWATARRDAVLHDALLCIANWDAQISQGATQAGARPHDPQRPAPAQLPPGMTAFLRELDSVVMLTAEEHEPLIAQTAQNVVHIDVPFPTPAERAALIDLALERADAPRDLRVDLVNLARRFALPPRRLEEAARTAAETAARRDPDAETWLVSADDLLEACGRHLRHDLKSVAERITNNHRWDDLVLPEEVEEPLREMLAYVRHAGRVYDDWGFGDRHSLSQGISALFSGPPGTGKTMCASVVARELGMEIFRIDLSTVVSKWVGETEKNLARVFEEAQRSSAIVLFDEADALFAKRTDVKSSNDRYANLEVNFLLQKMESFRGISILTSNHENAIDPAFKRRLTFRVRFAKPNVCERALLWSKMFPSGVRVADDVDPVLLAERYDMSGGNIRNAALRAAFLAADADREIDLHLCMLAAERECMEMGMLVRSHPDSDGPPAP